MVERLFLAVPQGCLQFVIVVFPDRTLLLVLLFEQWRMTVQKYEAISHKRWSNNEKWLQAYEEEFQKRYEHSNPFFKKGSVKSTYAEVVSSKQTPYHQIRSVNEYVQNRQHNERRSTQDGARNVQKF